MVAHTENEYQTNLQKLKLEQQDLFNKAKTFKSSLTSLTEKLRNKELELAGAQDA